LYKYFERECHIALRNLGLSKKTQTWTQLMMNNGALSTQEGWTEGLAGHHPCVPGGSLPQVLQEVDLPILTQEECVAALLTLKKPFNGKTFLCTGSPDGGRDACQVSGNRRADRFANR
jgi:hypothetical protein